MIDRIKSQLTTRMVTKNEEMLSWTSPICPKIKKRLDKNTELANTCYAELAGDGIYSMEDRGYTYIVEINVESCSCRRWNLTGIPCPHSIACCRRERKSPIELVHKCYSIESYHKAYSHLIVPCRDRRERTKMNGCPIAPPLYVKKVGNPGHNRRRAPEEVADGRGGTRMTRHGVVIHCGHYKLPGHNRSSCSDLKAGIPPYVPAPKQHVRRRRRAEPTTEEDQEAEPNVQEQQEEAPNVQDQQEAQHTQDEHVITQDINDQIPLSIVYTHDMLNEMIFQRPMPKTTTTPRPLPDCSFITAAREALGTGTTSTSTTAGYLATKAAAMRIAKEKVFAAQRDATQEQRYESHEKQAADVLARREAEKAKKEEEKAKKKAEALAKKEEEKAKKRAEALAKREEEKAKKAQKMAAEIEEKKKVAIARREAHLQAKLREAEEKKAAAQAKRGASTIVQQSKKTQGQHV